MDWRVMAGVTIVTWGAYNVVLKVAAGRMAWQVSLFLFVLSYSIVVVAFSLAQGGVLRAGLFSRTSLWPIAAGVLCGLGAITYFKGIGGAPGSVFVPLVGLSALVSGVGCLVFLHEPVSLRVVLGMACALAAIVLLSK